MRSFGILFCLFICFSCSNDKPDRSSVIIDLKETASSIDYSLFVDSVNYLTLEMTDSLFLSGVRRVCIDGDFIFMEDTRRGGIFVFSQKERRLIANLNYYGQGPGEFSEIRTFTLDKKNKQIIIFSYPSLYRYTYEGVFVESIHTDKVGPVEFHYLDTGEFLCFAPEDMGGGEEGVWLADSSLQFIKMLREIPAKQLIFVRSVFHNGTEDGMYYYDPVWEDISYITRDSVELLYQFDFKQRIPEKERNKEFSEHVMPYSFISVMAYSEHYILLNYFNFDQSPDFWVLLDKHTKQTIVSHQLWNDLNNIRITSPYLFYIDDHTWCRVLDLEENNLNVVLEFIHLKR
ncbi:MAG: 6-bladed beta-propeller [Tannerellaceae bacterium]|nr:6-bladed beta-propeller [Tannerellaceae bacterium]